MRTLFLLMMSIQAALAGISSYSDLLVSDPPNVHIASETVRVTYLGTNGYQLETQGHSLLIDPYFSRVSLARAALGWPLRPDQTRIEQGMAHLKRNSDAILITHGHFDHLMDAPAIMKMTGARLFGSSTTVELATRAGADAAKCRAVRPGAVRTVGPWRITVLPASHDRLLMIGVPFNGRANRAGPPVRAADWVCGEPLSYLITANGTRIFVDSGGTPSVMPPSQVGQVDLAILGMALPDSRARFAATIEKLKPRYILPSHQDNFFAPLDRGFQFAPLTDFQFVRQKHQQQRLPGRLILLDYFRPWTVPHR